MLDDRQIDELERLIVFSELKDLPMVLSRAIPLLFSELRLVKATLDSKVSNFLGGFDAVTQRTEGVKDQDQEGVQGGEDDPADMAGHKAGSSVVHPSDGGRSDERPGSGLPDKPRRGRPKGSKNKRKLDTGGLTQEVGGQDSGLSGESGEGGIEAVARLIEVQQQFNSAGGAA
jgi:hypothetical protein